MKKILVATGVYPPESGGPATYTRLIEEQLPAHGICVEVLPFREVRWLPKIVRHFVYFLKCIHRGRGVSIIFAQDTVSVGLPAALAAKLLRKKFLVRVPGDWVWEQARQRWHIVDSIDDFQKKKYGPKVKAIRAIQRFVLHRADRVIVPSEYFASVVSGWGIEKRKIQVIYNGVVLSDNVSVPAHMPSRPFMVSVGRLVPWKGFTFLISILSSLPEWNLVIVGDGPDRKVLEDQVRRSGVEGRVHIVGALARNDVLSWCKAADAFVLNTSFESFSYQVVEAMAMGAPVITTLVGSIPELLEPGVEGLLLTPNDKAGFVAAIESTLREPIVWKERCKAAEQKSKKFSIDHTICELLELFQTI